MIYEGRLAAAKADERRRLEKEAKDAEEKLHETAAMVRREEAKVGREEEVRQAQAGEFHMIRTHTIDPVARLDPKPTGLKFRRRLRRRLRRRRRLRLGLRVRLGLGLELRLRLGLGLRLRLRLRPMHLFRSHARRTIPRPLPI